MIRPNGAPRHLTWTGRLCHAVRNTLSKKSHKHVFARISVNFAFWGCVAVASWLLSYHVRHIPLIGGDGTPLGLIKIRDFADGDLWGLQVLSSIILLLLVNLLRGWRSAPMFRDFLRDELFSACLNFSTLFFIAAAVPFADHRWHFVVPMLAGMSNIIAYAFWSNFRYQDEPVRLTEAS